MLEIAEDSGGLAFTIHVVAEGRRKSINDRHVEYELAYVAGLLTEHLLSEVITDEAIVAAEIVYEFAGI